VLEKEYPLLVAVNRAAISKFSFKTFLFNAAYGSDELAITDINFYSTL